ncbi:MAG: AAA family ATPase, partial [Desulfobacteraceae bacterium]|nr:AAA family ATPase [Desulfobacteraceae bacterium]
MGTPHYMAPEIVLDRSMLDYRFDLYSLGIMIFHLIVRELPIMAKNPIECMKRHCFAQVKFDDEIRQKLPSWLIALVNRLCEKNPVDRFRSANAVIEFINKEGGFSYEVETQQTRESYIHSSRFVGREKEFKQMTEFINARLKGRDVADRPIVFVAGQSGLGKSRLMREVCYHSQLSGNLFIEGNCYEGVASEYGPVAEILGYLVALAQASGSTELLDDYAQSLVKIEPKLSTTLETKPVESSGDTAAEKLALMEDISSFILRLSDVVPFALYINDLQWARSGTTDILSYVAMRIHQKELVQKTQLALLGSFRDDEIEGKPILKLLELVKVEVITLGVLGSGEVKLLLCSMLGVEELPQEFVNRVVEETAGNPFFVESVMRVLVENGTVYLENGEWAADAEVGELEIPSIDDVFLRRVSLLDDAQRTVLEVIAVCGLPTSPAIINQVCQMDSDTFHQALTILMQRQMVKRRDGTEIRYQTNHDRMRETVYQNLEPERLKELHQGIAEAIESVYESNLEPHIANLARHYYRTDNKEKALKYCLAAGDMAKEQYANELGIEMYQHVLDLLPQEEAESRFKAEVTEKLADLFFNIGDYPKSESYYNQVLAQRKEKDVQYRINNMISNIYLSKGEIPKALDFSITALSILGYSFPKTKIGIMVNLMGTMFVHMFHSMFPWLVRTVKKEKKREKLLNLVEMYRSLCHINWSINPNGLMLSAFRASNVSDKIGISPQAVIAYSLAAIMYSVLTFYKRSIKFFNKASKICEHIEHPLAQCYLTVYEGVTRLYMAQWQRSLDVSLQAKELLKKLGNMEYLSVAYTNLFYSNYYKGDI